MWVQNLILAAIILIALEEFLVKRFGLKRLEFTRSFDTQHAYCGQEIHMIEVLGNRKLLPIPILKVESRIDSELRFGNKNDLNIRHDAFHVSVFSLMPYTRITRTHQVTCHKRGYYELKTAALSANSLTGLASISADFSSEAHLHVFPQSLTLQELKLPSHSWQGDRVVRRWIMEDPFMASGVREYTTSDPMKNINWKVSAKNDKLQVNQYDPTAKQRLMILLNVDTAENQWTNTDQPEKIEYGLSVAATVIEMATRNLLEVGFGTNGFLKGLPRNPIRIEPKTGKQQNLFLMEHLARLAILRSINFHAFLEQEVDKNPTFMDYLVLTSEVTRNMEPYLNRLRRMGNSVEIYVI